MDAAVGEQSEEMKLAAALRRMLQRLDDRGMREEFAAGDQCIDARDVHVHHATRSDIQMAHFAVAHLPIGQADEVI